MIPRSDPRSWTLTLPPGMPLLNANDRDGHWARRKRLAADLRQATGWLARSQRIPRLDRAHVIAVYEPPDRRRRDPANWQPSFKACVDGLVDAGVFADDDAAHVLGPDPRLGPVCRWGRIVLTITELAPVRAKAAAARAAMEGTCPPATSPSAAAATSPPSGHGSRRTHRPLTTGSCATTTLRRSIWTSCTSWAACPDLCRGRCRE